MSVKLSRALVNALAGGAATAKDTVGVITTIAFADGGAGNDSITDSANGLAGFSVGDLVTVVTTSGLNDGTYEILTVAAGSLGVATGSLTAELAAAAGASSLVSHRGHSIRDIFKYGVIRLNSGTRPTTANNTEVGTYLMEELTKPALMLYKPLCCPVVVMIVTAGIMFLLVELINALRQLQSIKKKLNV